MAEIQIEYKEWFCRYRDSLFCAQCLTSAAEDLGCKYFECEQTYTDENGVFHIPYNEMCIFAEHRIRRKGFVAKTYDIEEEHDPFNPWLDCAILKVKNDIYHCDKIILNGTCVYNNEENEP